MQLYIGGYAQGKTQYVMGKYPNAQIFDETNFEKMEEEKSGDQPVILNHFHLCMRKMLKDKSTLEILADLEKLLQFFPNLQIICDEIGNGIVPMEKEERRWREETGRILIELAKRATRVERILCQIPQVIK